MLLCSVAGIDICQRDCAAQGANLVAPELDVGSSGAEEAEALASLHWQFMGDCGKQ